MRTYLRAKRPQSFLILLKFFGGFFSKITACEDALHVPGTFFLVEVKQGSQRHRLPPSPSLTPPPLYPPPSSPPPKPSGMCLKGGPQDGKGGGVGGSPGMSNPYLAKPAGCS